MITSPKRILLEGVDFSGKSSVINKLVKNNKKITVRHGSLLEYNPFLDAARMVKKDGSEWIGYLYAEALAYDIKKYIEPKTDLVQDSTILLRSLAYNTVAGHFGVVEKLMRQAVNHPKFDKTYLLVADLETRKYRLQQRIKEGKILTVNDLKVINDPVFFLKMEKCIVEQAKILFDAEVLDTTGMTVEDVAAKIR